jgi:hypothetical protein
MADIVTQHNIGGLGSSRAMSAASTATAGGTGAGTQVNGVTFDRFSFANGSPPLSAELAVVFDTTLATGHTMSVAFDFQHSPDGSTWTDYLVQAATVAATGNAGGTLQTGQITLAVDLAGANRYVRCNYTPTFSAGSVDTAALRAVAFFAGFDRLAASP